MKRFAYSVIGVGVLLLFALLGGCSNNSPADGSGMIRITFHDTVVDGSTIRRIDMTVVRTELIDQYDARLVVSTEPRSFNLLAACRT